jgi:cobalt/nickel transport system permease protein
MRAARIKPGGVDAGGDGVHIPDGFINAGTSIGAGLVSAGGLGVCLRRARETLAEKQVPLAGLTAAFVFAVQMLNFPVAAGTSGHLVGGVLAAVLVGPWVGTICIAVVLVVQALFADGGLTALGLNILNMGLVGAMGGYAVFAGLRRVLPRSRAGVLTATAVASWVSVVLASVAFSVEYAIGGSGGVSPTAVLSAMVGVHALIGIGEAVITTLTVGAVLTSRPDLVHGAADLLPPLEVRTAAPAPVNVGR